MDRPEICKARRAAGCPRSGGLSYARDHLSTDAGYLLQAGPSVPLTRIANDDELAAALTTIDNLIARKLDTGEEAYLSALSILIHAYESEHHAIPDATPAEVLRELAEANSLTGTLIAQRSGIVPSTVSALMANPRADDCPCGSLQR